MKAPGLISVLLRSRAKLSRMEDQYQVWKASVFHMLTSAKLAKGNKLITNASQP